MKKQENDNNNLPHRKNQRLKEFDYSNTGYYFVTICIDRMGIYLGKILDGRIILNKNGMIVNECWKDLTNHYPNCELDTYIIMPDHFHGIISIEKFSTSNDTRNVIVNKEYGLSEIIRGFKTFSSKKINEILKKPDRFQWQKSFYDRIIRNEKELFSIRKYIEQNPLRWEIEKGNAENLNL